MILTACSLDELDGGLLGLLLLEVDDGEGGAAGLDEGATELIAKAAGGACHNSHLARGERSKRGAQTKRGGWA